MVLWVGLAQDLITHDDLIFDPPPPPPCPNNTFTSPPFVHFCWWSSDHLFHFLLLRWCHCQSKTDLYTETLHVHHEEMEWHLPSAHFQNPISTNRENTLLITATTKIEYIAHWRNIRALGRVSYIDLIENLNIKTVNERKATRPSLRVFCGKLSKWEPCKSCKIPYKP